MGLSLCVGILSDLAEDSEGLADFRRQFDKVNGLSSRPVFRLTQKPAKLRRVLSCDLAGYSALHAFDALRLALAGSLPPAPVADATKDRLSRLTSKPSAGTSRRPTGPSSGSTPDAPSEQRRVLVPIEFPNVLSPAGRRAWRGPDRIVRDSQERMRMLAGASRSRSSRPRSEEVVTPADSGGRDGGFPARRRTRAALHRRPSLLKRGAMSLRRSPE